MPLMHLLNPDLDSDSDLDSDPDRHLRWIRLIRDPYPTGRTRVQAGIGIRAIRVQVATLNPPPSSCRDHGKC